MSGDWIKMRSDLYRDPKVCVIADILLEGSSPLSSYVSQLMQRDMSITRNVMRNVTVGALVSVWGVLRHRGKRVNDDLSVNGCTVAIIDDLSDIPGFGAAMESVGWAVQDAESIVLPRFFEEFNVDPSEELKAKNAERQRRFREKQKAESNVTVASQSNDREEKRREEKKEHKDTLRFDFAKALISSGVDPQVAADYIATRKAKKCVQTETAFNLLVNESAKACLSLADAVSVCCKRGWGGFEASWIKPEDRPKSSAASCDPRSAEVIILPDGRRVTQAGIELMRRIM